MKNPYDHYLANKAYFSAITVKDIYESFTHKIAAKAIEITSLSPHVGGSVAEWLACWTQAQKAQVQIAAATLSGNSLRQTVHTHCASVHQEAKLVATLLRIAGVTAGLAESNGSLPLGL